VITAGTLHPFQRQRNAQQVNLSYRCKRRRAVITLIAGVAIEKFQFKLPAQQYATKYAPSGHLSWPLCQSSTNLLSREMQEAYKVAVGRWVYVHIPWPQVPNAPDHHSSSHRTAVPNLTLGGLLVNMMDARCLTPRPKVSRAMISKVQKSGRYAVFSGLSWDVTRIPIRPWSCRRQFLLDCA